MKRPLDYATEQDRLRYVLEELDRRHVSGRELSRAAGLNPTDLSSLVPRLERGENVALRKWRALWRVLGVDLLWWVDGVGDPNWNADVRAREIRELAAAAKEAEDLRREADFDEVPSTRNVLKITRRLKRKSK